MPITSFRIANKGEEPIATRNTALKADLQYIRQIMSQHPDAPSFVFPVNGKKHSAYGIAHRLNKLFEQAKPQIWEAYRAGLEVVVRRVEQAQAKGNKK